MVKICYMNIVYSQTRSFILNMLLVTNPCEYSINFFFERRDVKTTEHCDSSKNIYGLIKRAYSQFMRLGIDIIFRMKTIGTNDV